MDNVVELFGILANLARFCEDASEDICQRGASTILQTTNSKINDTKLITKASYLIENLLKIQRNADLIIQNGGIDVLNKVLDKYPKDEEIDLSVK